MAFGFTSGGSTFNIKPNTTLERIRRGLGTKRRERKRKSEKRRRRLEKTARWVSGKNVRVRFQPEGAKCQKAPSGADHDLEVYIPTDECEQPATELDPAVWDFVFQKAELVHELGHVLYTDFDTFETYVDKIDDLHRKRLFQRLFNINEDGAIERQLSADYNVRNDLHLKNANLMVQGDPGPKNKAGDYELRFSQAVECILLDWAKYETDRSEKLLDPAESEYQFADPEVRTRVVELLGTLKQMVADIVTEPDAAERVRITYEYFEVLVDDFEEYDDVTDEDLLMQLMSAFANDGEVYVVMPGDPPDDAEALEPDEDDVVIFIEPPQGGEPDEQEPGEKYGPQVEADEEGDEAIDVEKWGDAVDESGETLQMITGDCEADPDTWAQAERYAKRYEKQFRRVLQAERETETRRGQRAGRPDTQALWQLGYGNSRVFENDYEPDEKDYSVVLVIDRSGSMGGDVGCSWIVDEAEAVVAGMSMALEAVGAETAVLSVGGKVFLEKPFGVTTESKKDVLVRGHSDGGTPLGKALKLALERLDGRAGQKLVFAVTDGEPTDGVKYEEALETATVPVIGTYFKEHKPDIDDVRHLYHRITAASKADVSRKVEAMIKRLLV